MSVDWGKGEDSRRTDAIRWRCGSLMGTRGGSCGSLLQE